jgi:hypothetical protein
VRKCVESQIEFDFSAARNVFEHDTTSSKCQGTSTADGNTFWPGVDFRVEDERGWIWLEVKNWRGRMRGSFAHKLKSQSFADEMRSKFLGTAAYLAWHGTFAPVSIRYVLLFEPPDTSDEALLATFQDLIRAEMAAPRRLNISIYVWNLDTWNQEFPLYQAKKIR